MEAKHEQAESGRRAAAILTALCTAVSADEITTGIRPALDTAVDAVFAWLADRRPVPDPPPPLVVPPVVGPKGPDDVPLDLPAGRLVRSKGTAAQPVLKELETFLEAHADRNVIVEWRVEE